MKSAVPVSILSLGLLISVAWCPAHAFRFVVISEIQKDPVGGASECPGDKCHEFVEIANLGTDTLRLDSLFLTSGAYTDSVFARTDTIPGDTAGVYARSVLAPGEIALILDTEYDTAPALGIAGGTILLTVNHVSITGGLTATRGLLLYRGTRSILSDSVASAIDPGLGAYARSLTLTAATARAEGFSLIPQQVLFGPPSYHANPDSLDPGAFGAVSNTWLVEYRLGTASLLSPAVPCTLAVLKAGLQITPATSWSLRAVQTGATVSSGTLAAGDSVRSIAVDIPKDSAQYRFTVSDNTSSAAVTVDLSTVWIPSETIRISEIFPRATRTTPEWIELTNVSSVPINLAHWRFGTPESTDTVTASELLIHPGSYHVLTKDRSLFSSAHTSIAAVSEPAHWPALDNYSDTVVLYSPLDTAAVERVFYSSGWFDSWDSQSLERISLTTDALSSQAWALAAYPTPGQPNRSTTWRGVDSPRMHIGPIPFTPNGDGTDDLLLVEMQVPADATATITVYGFDGNVAYKFPLPVSEKQYWDGNRDNGSHAAVGPFFVVAEIRRGGNTHLLRQKGVIWR